LCAVAALAGGLEAIERILRDNPARYTIFYLLLTRTVAWFALLYTVAGIVIVRGRRRATGASVTQM
jgi:hypothetical protein